MKWRCIGWGVLLSSPFWLIVLLVAFSARGQVAIGTHAECTFIYPEMPGACSADFDNDGIVGGNDVAIVRDMGRGDLFALVRAYFGQECPPSNEWPGEIKAVCECPSGCRIEIKDLNWGRP
jgi:hypothetical protein